MANNKKEKKKRDNRIIIAVAVLAAVIVIAAVAAVMIRTGKSTEKAEVAAVQDGQTPIDESEGYEEIEPGVFVNASGEILDDNAVRELAEGENPEDIEIQVKASADYVEPGKGTLDIAKIQGFTAKSGGSGTSAASSGNSGSHSQGEDAKDGQEEKEGVQTDTDQNGGDQPDDGQSGTGPAEDNQNNGGQEDVMVGSDQGTVLSDPNLSVNAVGSYTGSFLEDGSDEPASNVAALLITNSSSQMLQIGQVTFQVNDTETATFKVTDLPAGTSALVLEQNGREYQEGDDYSYGKTATAYIDTPSLESDKFDIVMENGKVQLNNKTDEAYSKVYVYYKYVQVGGAYKGGITYRTPVENVPAKGSAEAVAGHMNPDSTQIIDVQIVE